MVVLKIHAHSENGREPRTRPRPTRERGGKFEQASGEALLSARHHGLLWFIGKAAKRKWCEQGGSSQVSGL